MKKILVVSIIIVFLLSCAGCFQQTKERNTPHTDNNIESDMSEVFTTVPITNEDNTLYISNATEKLKAFNTLDELEKNSPFIISGICVSAKPVYQNETLYTLSEIKIHKSLKGGLKEGSTIFIVEMGGRVAFGDFVKGCNIEPKDFETNQNRLSDDYSLVIGTDGYFPLKKNEDVLLFLGDTSGFLDQVSDPLYDIIGVSDGKLYKQDDNTYARPIASETDEYKFTKESIKISIDQISSKLSKEQ